MDRRSVFFLAIVLAAFAVAYGRIMGRKLRQTEACDSPGFFGDVDDCRKFYRCAEHPTDNENNPIYLKYSFRCPNGTVFDEALSTCNHPEAVPNKPENCQVYDPEEPSNGNNGGYTSSINNNDNSNNNNGNEKQIPHPHIIIPVNHIVYPPIALTYGHFLHG